MKARGGDTRCISRVSFHSYYVGSGVAFLARLGLLRCSVVAGKAVPVLRKQRSALVPYYHLQEKSDTYRCKPVGTTQGGVNCKFEQTKINAHLIETLNAKLD